MGAVQVHAAQRQHVGGSRFALLRNRPVEELAPCRIESSSPLELVGEQAQRFLGGERAM